MFRVYAPYAPLVDNVVSERPDLDHALLERRITEIKKKSSSIARHVVASRRRRERLRSDIRRIADWQSATAWCMAQLQRTADIHLRDVQLVPVVLHFDPTIAGEDAATKPKHTCFEVLTGEGKTLIIAVIAAVNVLLGRKVDVITCTDLLADANELSMRAFYSALEITSAANTHSDTLTYTADIVYGSMYHFAKDFLRDWLTVDAGGLPARPHQVCIIDEVDLLAIDNAEHLVKVARPFAGMELLADAYAQIRALRPVRVDHVPRHLRPLCAHMADVWRASHQSVLATMRRDTNYIIEGTAIVPVDSEHSGMILRGAAFANGVQQFLELREALPLSCEILDSVCVSNAGYVRMYETICGLTGTLGDRSETQLLCEMFDGRLRCFRIPAYRNSRLMVDAAKFDDVDERIASMPQATITIAGSNNSSNIYELERVIGRERCEELFYAEGGNRIDCVLDAYRVTNDFEPFARVPVELKMPAEYFREQYMYHCCCVYDKMYLTWQLLVLNDLVRVISYDAIGRDQYVAKLREEIYANLNKLGRVVIFNLNHKELREEFIRHKDIVIYEDVYEMQVLPERKANDTLIFVFDAKFESKRIAGNAQKFQVLTEYGILPKTIGVVENNRLDLYSTDIRLTEILETERQIERDRAVLIICENVFEVRALTAQLRKHMKRLYVEIINYTGLRDESAASIEVINEIKPGDIILTTNIGARGADFQTSAELDRNGGLHVILTFIPTNKRVQQQAVGRTARNGRPGSVQFIVSKKKTSHLTTSIAIDEILQRRDEIYLEKLTNTYTHRLPKLKFHDALNQRFRDCIKTLRTDDDAELAIVCDDLIEFWAIWLKLNEGRICDEPNAFERFKGEAQHIVDRSGFHNPVNALRRANLYIVKEESRTRAGELLLATLDDTVFCDRLVVEYIKFARAAILQRCLIPEAERMLLAIAADDKRKITIEAYLQRVRLALAARFDAIDIVRALRGQRATVREHLDARAFIDGDIRASGKTLALLAAAGTVALRRKHFIDALSFLSRAISTYCRRVDNVRPDLEEAARYLGAMCKDNQTSAAIALIAYSATFDSFLRNIVLVVRKAGRARVEDGDFDDDAFFELCDVRAILETSIGVIVEQTIITPHMVNADALDAIVREECIALQRFRGRIIDALFEPFVDEQEEDVRDMFNVLRRKNVARNINKILVGVKYICVRINERIDAVAADALGEDGEEIEMSDKDKRVSFAAVFGFVFERFNELVVESSELNVAHSYNYITG